jgi:mRNA-degrading endonuclease toxin of MazEF toxin-antitoxin module
VPLTSKLAWAKAPGNVELSERETGLDRGSVTQVTLLLAVDKDCLTERAGRLAPRLLARVLAGIDLVLGRSGG